MMHKVQKTTSRDALLDLKKRTESNEDANASVKTVTVFLIF